MAAFPQELIDQIIDELRDDPISLRACSLTAVAWLPRSRLYIHRNFVFSGDQESVDRAQQYADCGLTNFVRRLIVDFHPKESGETAGRHKSPHAALPVTFPRVVNLTLSDLMWDFEAPETKESIMAAFPLVKTLVVQDVGFLAFDTLVSMLMSFPSLSNLNLGGVHLLVDQMSNPIEDSNTKPVDERTWKEYGQCSLKLDHLVLGNSCPKARLARWFQDQKIKPWVRTLTIQACQTYRTDFLALGDISALVGPSLQDLVVDLRSVRNASVSGEELARCTHLRSIEFHAILLSYRGTPNFRWISCLLSGVPLTRLQRVTFEILVSHFQSLRPLYIGEIDEILGGTGHDADDWPRGLKVRFIVQDNYGDPHTARGRLIAILEALREEMPRAMRSGALSVDIPSLA